MSLAKNKVTPSPWKDKCLEKAWGGLGFRLDEPKLCMEQGVKPQTAFGSENESQAVKPEEVPQLTQSPSATLCFPEPLPSRAHCAQYSVTEVSKYTKKQRRMAFVSKDIRDRKHPRGRPNIRPTKEWKPTVSKMLKDLRKPWAKHEGKQGGTQGRLKERLDSGIGVYAHRRSVGWLEFRNRLEWRLLWI